MLHSTFARDALKPPQPRGMGKGLSIALLVHVGLLIALAIGVSWRSRTPDAVQAELWAAVPQSAAPRAVAPEPAPAPAPTPKPAPKVEEAPPPPKPLPDPQIAIEKAKQEKEKARKLEEEREREREKQEALREKQEAQRKEQEALRKKQEADRRKAEADEKKREQENAERLLAQRKANLERMMGQAGASGDPRSTGAAQQSAGPSSSYAGLIRSRVKPNIVFSDTLPGNPAAEVEVRAGPDGTILSRRLSKSSGSKEWDEAVLRAIDRTGVLPRDVDGRVPPALIITFRPND